jgi:hypothetical protein
MLTQQHTQIHEKCLQILDLMDRAEKNLTEARWMLNQYDNGGVFSNINLFTNRYELLENLQIKKAVYNRLIGYYASTMTKLIMPAAKRVFFHIHNN